MTTMFVTVPVTVTGLPDAEARAYARNYVERRGLQVDKITVRAAAKGGGKPFAPKAGKPGSTLVREGRAFQVWADAPAPQTVWAIPTTSQEGDAPIYQIDMRSLKGRAAPFTATGGRYTAPTTTEMGLAA